jgi:hypothetical protein
MTSAGKLSEKWLKDEQVLLRIVGTRLTSVQFVLSYLILGFDEKGALTTLVWPEIVNRASVTKYGDAEYRNSLCSLIEDVVDTATLQQDETINILFRSGIELIIRLRLYAGVGERAVFNIPGGTFRVF